MLFYIYRIVSHAPAFLHSFLLLATTAKGIGLKRCYFRNFLMLLYIYLIVPHAPAFLHSFLILATVVKGIGLKRHIYFYSLVLEFSCVFILNLFDNTLRNSIFTQLPITSDCCKGIGLEHHYISTPWY